MDRRLEFHQILLNLIGPHPVYFQPPNNYKIQYPCIVYTRDDESVSYANNAPYRKQMRYQVTVIDRDPDSLIPEKVSMLPLCSLERIFVSDDLNHSVYNIFF